MRPRLATVLLVTAITTCPFLFPPSKAHRLLFSTPRANAKVAGSTIVELAKGSDLIVVARIESIRVVPSRNERWARAAVNEVWKGQAHGSVEYLASPTWTCDISTAIQDENVLLFLHKDVKVGWFILDSGRGRMPLNTRDGKTYALVFVDVSLPPHIKSPDPKGSGSDSWNAVELTRLKELVKDAIR